MSRQPTQPFAARHAAGLFVLGVLSLGALVFALHGSAIHHGLFMDDWAHYRQLRDCGWSLGELTSACRLELVGPIADYWWLPDCTLRFFRPVAFGLMKLTYTLSGWSPAAMHVASLLWHLATCALLMILLRRLGAARWLAWAGAVLFALHPGHVATTQWIACQSELMVTTFILAATLCWGHFRRWPGFHEQSPAHFDPAPPSPAWAVGAVVFFMLALGCRENAIMFPFVMLAMELLATRRAWWEATALYGACVSVVATYLVVRSQLLGGVALPPRPYIVPPGAPDFVPFVFAKACYYLICEFFFVPCVPIGGLPYFTARPLVFYGLALGAFSILVLVFIKTWRRGPGLFATAWVFGFIAPVLPAFASPHHLYLPAVGWTVVAMTIIRGIGVVPSDAPLRKVRRRKTLMVGAAVGMGLLFGISTFYFGLAIDTGQQVEDVVIAEVAASPKGLKNGDTIYIANLPILAHYVRLAVEEQTGLRDLKVVPLTWAPRVLGPASNTEWTPIDARTIEIHVANDRYFSGPLGLLAQSANGRPVAELEDDGGERGVRVEVLDADEEGVRTMRFTFDRPITDPDLHFFWGSRVRGAYEIQSW